MGRGNVSEAIKALGRGEFVLVYDSDKRERETDLVIPSQFVTADAVRRMRKDGGGLICTTVLAAAWKRLGIPFLSDLFHEARQIHPLLAEVVPDDIPYDTKSAFAITINHRKTFTGITDRDRALTISNFAMMVREAIEFAGPDEEVRRAFGRLFRAPGHVMLLNASEGLLSERSGHTEMATALVQSAGLIPSATICEMMGDDGRALAKELAAGYARANGLIFLEGADVKEFWDGQTGGAVLAGKGNTTAGVVMNGR
jgi:3,4-dihydroxy 2-butanone 4-phosphate synthase